MYTNIKELYISEKRTYCKTCDKIKSSFYFVYRVYHISFSYKSKNIKHINIMPCPTPTNKIK
ncbi:hypothetical protein PFBG_01201 [Plasmodium falciparum 7G8]|uniref:Uncharacterized protein n=1 Tax=Plasmodium falciparum (isolate 7G8) TaxID=57266 RepID=W7FCB7_PLAF8|nr:hypothetical protein PFBG_01201 [Plasmodium falciparum 7G8]